MKEIYYKIRPIGDTAYCVVTAKEFNQSLHDWFSGMELGEELVVSRIELTEEEFEKMPEYEG